MINYFDGSHKPSLYKERLESIGTKEIVILKGEKLPVAWTTWKKRVPLDILPLFYELQSDVLSIVRGAGPFEPKET